MMRLATEEDMPLVNRLVRAFLAEQELAGSYTLPTLRSVRQFTDLAEAYSKGRLDGLVILAPEGAGMVIAGEDFGPPPWDTTLGRQCTVWLIWVAPEQRKAGLGLQMLYWGRPQAVVMGFQTAVMAVRTDNPEGTAITEAFGARPRELIYTFPLKEEPNGGRRRQ